MILLTVTISLQPVTAFLVRVKVKVPVNVPVPVNVIHVSKFEESAVSLLALGIMLNTFQSAKEQRTTHHVQVTLQRVHDMNQRSVLFLIVVGRLRQRVIQNLIESGTYQLLADEVSQLVLLVLVTFDD